MSRLFVVLIASLLILIILLLNSIFFGTNSYQKKAELINENDIQIKKNNDIKNQNDILEFEIKNAQQSNEHVENFAREKLNLVYPEEELISFEKKENKKEEI